MKKIIKVLFICFLFLPFIVDAKEINLYLFYGEGCPHCADEKVFLNEYLKENEDVKLHTYEVWYNSENQEKFLEVQKILDVSARGVPYLVIGNNVVSGFVNDSTEEIIENTINYYRSINYTDEAGIYLGVVDGKEETVKNGEKYVEEEFDIPILGKKKARDVSLLLSAIVIGLVDGFNPCAMWILLFLSSMLLGMKNKKRMWALGITFLFTSAFVYFLFMIAWLNLAVLLNKIIYIRIGISLVAIIFGTISVLRYINSLNKDDGCEVVDTKNRKKIINKINKIVKEKTFIISLIGIIVLAISVNVIELLCSLGLPVMYTEILSLNDLSSAKQIIYILIYVLFFLLDDLIIFAIAMKTLEIKAISNKYGKYSHLIGGIIMMLIGILMLFKPEWLMFNF